MATIKDIARAAGVSHATVSNVLNHKGIVSAEKVKLVLDAAAAMGYRLNEAAASLRSGRAKVLALILPDTESAAYNDLYRSCDQLAAEAGYGVMLRVTGNRPATERAAIHDALSARARYVFSVTSLPSPEKEYAELENAGAGLAFALRDAPKGALCGGFDMALAARELAARVLSDRPRTVGLMTNPVGYKPEAAFRDEFTALMESAGANVLHVQTITSQYGKEAFALAEAMPDAVVATGVEMAQAVLQAVSYLGLPPLKVYSLAPARLLETPGIPCYRLNYRALGARLCRALMEGRTERLLLPGDGFSVKGPAPLRRSVLSLLSNDSPFVRALTRLGPRLEKDTGVRLAVTLRPAADMRRAFERPEELSGFDMARMDMALIGRFGKSVFLPVSALGVNQAKLSCALLPGLMREYGMVDGESLALPLDPSCHLLFYRKDLTESPHFQRRFFEAYREEAALPNTYEDYARAAQCLDQIAKEGGEPLRGALLTGRPSEPLADLASLERWPALTLEDMERFLRRRRALESASLLLNDGSWLTAARAFAQGRSALMIAHSNYVGYLAREPLSSVAGVVGYAPVPGKRPLLGGGVIGALRQTQRKAEAAALLEWLFSAQARDCLALLGGCSPCLSAYENPEITDVYPWMQTVRHGLESGARRGVFPRPGADQMEREKRIADVCRQAVQGNLSAGKALEKIKEETEGEA